MVLWCFNGLAQSFLWPPIVRLMASLFEEKEYQKVTTAVVRGGSIGTVLIYLLSPLWILISGWRLVFWISATLGTGMLFVWLRLCPDIKQEPGMKEGRSESGMQFLKSPLIWGIMVAIVLQGALKDGVTTWMPSYISETFRFSNSASILSGILLPVLAILSVQAASYLYSRRSKAPLFSSGAIFLLGAVMAVLLRCFSGKNAVGSIICMAMLSGCMHGVNLILVCILPVFFKSSGRVSTVSGVLNSCTYVGSAVSVYGIARMAEHSGWNATIVLWIFLALGGMILCLTGIPAWKKRFGR